ncbi:hypothetical protein [Carnobacterium maltaromaticum]|uniref:hypothetical protein n=1 Tax=Carnobacterium maltaromaticum TaxID=2751 RepID=UPI0039BE9ED5
MLSNPYIIQTDENGELGKELPLNLVGLRYVGNDIKNDILVNDKVVSSLDLSLDKNDTMIIKNMGTYKGKPIDLNIKVLDSSSITVFSNGTVTIKQSGATKLTSMITINVYKHNTKTIYPDVYVGFSDRVASTSSGYPMVDSFGHQNLYGLYLPKELGTIVEDADVTQHDGVLDLSYRKEDTKNPETVYPIFKNTETGFIRGGFFGDTVGSNRTLTLFDQSILSLIPREIPRLSRAVPAPYDDVEALYTGQLTPRDITSFDVGYTVTQKLAEYTNSSDYPTDQTFKIKTNFRLDPIGGSPVEAVVMLENNQQVATKYYSGVPLKNSYEITFSTSFLQDYSGQTIQIVYKQRVESQKVNLMNHYQKYLYSFLFHYTSENQWERGGQSFQQKVPSNNQTSVRYVIKVDAKIENGKKVIQNKSTADYNPLDFISNLTSTFPGDSVSATFTKKVDFQNTGEQNIYITLKGSLSSITKDIVVKVVAIEGTLHFTEVPSELLFPTITLTGKLTDYEVSTFKGGKLVVSDERATRSPWSLTARLTENKTSNNLGDILYFRNPEGSVYNITNRTQSVMKNKNREPTKTIIDYTRNKQKGLFIRINPLFVKKGAYEGSVTWTLINAPN